MGNRTVAVRLTAEVGSYVTGMKQAAAATKDLTNSTLDTAQKNKQAFQTIGVGATAIGAGLAAGVAVAVKSFADFDQAMSGVQAATHESAAAMDDLREAALEAGARTAFSATEAADGIEALAKAGVSTASILDGGLNGALDLAAAGGLAVGEAAEIAATAMTQFQLSGEKVPHIADLLAAAAGKAQGEVSDMGMALKQVGLVANSTGLTIEETTGGLAAFASAGLIGSDAGTSFKSMLQRLTPQSKEAAGLMDELGFSAYDAQGNFIGLEGLAAELTTSLGSMTVEQRAATMSTLFGSDAVRAATVLYDQGAQGIAEWTDKVNDAGYAQETAAIKLDNLSGDIEAFMGSVETALIKTGEAGDGFARGTVQWATGVVNAYADLPRAAQSATLGVGAVAAAASLAAGGFLLLAPRIAETRDAMRTLSAEMPRTTNAMKGLGKGLGALAVVGAVATGFAALGRAFDDAAPSVDKLALSLHQFSVTGKSSGELLSTFGADFSDLGDTIRRVTDPSNQERFLDWGNTFFTAGQRAGDNDLLEARQDILALDQVLADLVSGGQADRAAELFNAMAAAAGEGGASTDEFRGVLTGYTDALAATNVEALLAAEGQGELGDAVGGATGEVVEQTESLSDLMDKIRDITGLVLGLRDASRGYEGALDSATEAVAKNGRTLDVTTEKGRANEAALDAIASSANDVLEVMIDSGEPLDTVSKKLGTQREALIQAAVRFGMTKEAAKKYADSVLRIPTAVSTTVAANIGPAAGAVARIVGELNRLNGRVVTSTVIIEEQRRRSVIDDGRTRSGLADGGWARGPGGPRDDLIPAYLSNGEFIVNAHDAGQNAELLEALNSGRRFASGGWVSGRASAGTTVATPAPHVSVTFADGMGWLKQFVRVELDDVALGASVGTWS